MNLSDINDTPIPQPTDEMVRFFEQRTREHINRVSNNLKKLYQTTEWGSELLERAQIHDDSKYRHVERIPYTWLTEFHRCKNEGIDFEFPPGVQEKVNQATEHHVTVNRHHPEFHNSPEDMNSIDVVEMVCDWTAMAQELGEPDGSARSWADKTVGKKWVFSDEQVKLIYSTIEQLDH